MSIDHRSVLANIHRFDQLVKYLRDEMGWPISQDSFDDDDDLFYDFTTEELGIDIKNAAKIQRIQRLRPLSTHQPWGIFFVKFEPKHLPVVALRRILGQVALKKRVSANNPEQAAWSADDLLFVSNYGEGESRQISFAHFAQSEVKKDLPTLKVLGWDNFDTKLHLDHVADLLTEKLSWPDDEENQAEWRKQWRSAFTLTHKEVITTSKMLSKKLAVLARNIRDRIETILAIETEDGPITKLMESFRKSLIHDLDEAGFADMYAQTIAYGLLSARITNPSGDSADDIIEAMPVTNPFLKELMETFLTVGGRKKSNSKLIGIDFDELGVSEIVELLDASNMEAVVRDFGDRNPQEDPVIHFFEGFLEEYDKKIRKERGVFYTPRSVVSFIVRSVDELLRTELDLEDGLADTATWGEIASRIEDLEIPDGVTSEQTFVQILDPATGTGTFLVEVIDLIHKTMTEKWQTEGHGRSKIENLWNDYVPKHLLPRLHGYELMMAPYTIAHMKIGLKLYETGYRFKNIVRLRVYLTNSLEPAQDFSGTFAFVIPALAHEMEEVNMIKRDKRFTVVIGNPPYSISSSNKGDWIQNLVKKYKVGLGETNVNSLSDDYIKFLSFGEHTISLSCVGVAGMITNNSYLDGITHRQMRQSLMSTYQKIFILDLHGSSKIIEKFSGEGKDKNVFDIQQGVSISLFISQTNKTDSKVLHFDCYGERLSKYQFLSCQEVCSIKWEKLEPFSPNNFFLPMDLSFVSEYEKGWPVNEIFRVFKSGIKFRKDNLLVKNHFDEASVKEMLEDIHKMSRSEILKKYDFNETSDWTLDEKSCYFDPKLINDIHKVSYRPFDERFTYYPLDHIKNIIVRGDSRVNLMKHLILGENISLVTSRFNRQVSNCYFMVSSCISDSHLLDNARDCLYVFPLYVFDDEPGLEFIEKKQSNLTQPFLDAFNSAFPSKDRNSLSESVTPDQIFKYAYSVFFSPNYQDRYSEFLKIDFPRLPLTRNVSLFEDLVELGEELVNVHLLKSPNLDNHITTLTGSKIKQIEKVSYFEETIWIDKDKTQGFMGVPKEVWNFHIGGYQVCEKWLKVRQAKGGKNPRPGRLLTDKDIDHYQKVIVALSETIRIMAEIDKVIDNHGGWPDAFQNS
jgi:predicted helicase